MCYFFKHFLSFLAQKMLKMTISTSVLGCVAPKPWSKYTTKVTTGMDREPTWYDHNNIFRNEIIIYFQPWKTFVLNNLLMTSLRTLIVTVCGILKKWHRRRTSNVHRCRRFIPTFLFCRRFWWKFDNVFIFAQSLSKFFILLKNVVQSFPKIHFFLILVFY